MPRRFPVSALLTRFRTVTDTENDDHITDAFLQAQLSTIYGALWGTVVETGYRYFETRETLVTDGSNILDEPAGIFATVSLDYVQPDGRRFEVTEIMAQERNLVAPPLSGTRARYFELVDDEFLLYPTPPTGQTYELRYVPQPPDLTSVITSTQVDVVTPDGEAFLTYGVAVMVAARKDLDPRLWSTEREAARQRLSDWAALRAFHQPRRQVVESSDWEDCSPGSWRWDPP